MKEIVVLGSTGSIGQNCLAVVREFSSVFRVIGLAAGSNLEVLAGQVDEFKPPIVSVAEKQAAAEFARRYAASGLKVLSGDEGLRELAGLERAQMVVNALVGARGLVPTIEAITAGKDVALANKESMVLAGEIVMGLAEKYGSHVLPIDSEHSGIHQCLAGRTTAVRRIVLTASGGPFLTRRPDDLRDVTPEEVVRHPIWRMGKRICVDSATLLNKGFEVIEAKWFFSLEPSRISILVHPQCVVHALVEFADGTTLAQISRPDMRIPILYAMSYPGKAETRFESCDLGRTGPLTFADPDLDQFPCLRLARAAVSAGGAVPVVLNAADEIAVGAFLERRIRFTDIVKVLEGSLERVKGRGIASVKDVLDVDAEARVVAGQVVSEVAVSL